MRNKVYARGSSRASPEPTSELDQKMLMHFLEQQMVVPVVDIDPDEDRTLHLKCFAQLLPNFTGGVDEQALGAKSFRVLDNVDRAEIHARSPFVLGSLLNRNHVVGTIDPNHMDQIQLQSNGGFQFHCREQKTAIARDPQCLLMWPHGSGRDAPRQPHAQRLLSVANQNLARSEAEQKVSNPKMEGAHVDAHGDILGQPLLKFRDDQQRVYPIPDFLIDFRNSERPF